MATPDRPSPAARSEARQSLPLSLHRPVELVLGGVLAIVPLLAATTGLFAMPAVGVIVSMALGAVLLTLGIAGMREQEGVSASSHQLMDRLVVGALLVAGLIFLLSGSPPTGAFLLIIGLAHGILSVVTRYTRNERVTSNEPS